MRTQVRKLPSVASYIAATGVLMVSTLFQTALATTTATTSANTNGYPMIHPNLGLADTDQATGVNGQSSQASSYMANSATVYSAGAPYPPVGTQNASASAYAYASEGVLRASVDAGVGTAGIVYNAADATSTANAGWGDSLTIDAGSSLLNQSGFITANFNVSGFFNVAADGTPGYVVQPQASEVRLAVRISGTGMAWDNACGGWAYCVTQRASSGHLLAGPLVDINTMIPVISLNIPVIFGQAVTLNYMLDMYSQVGTVTGGDGSPTSAVGSADYSHSLLWGGITGVFDANGDPVDMISATSASGFDYTRAYVSAVPIPAALWLFVSGTLGLFAVARPKQA